MQRITKRVTIPCFTKASGSLFVSAGAMALVLYPAFLDGFTGAWKATWLSALPWLVFALAFVVQYRVIGPCLQIYCAGDGTWMVALVKRVLPYLRALPVLISYLAILVMPPGLYFLVTNMLLSGGWLVQAITAFGLASHLLLLHRIIRQLLYVHSMTNR